MPLYVVHTIYKTSHKRERYLYSVKSPPIGAEVKPVNWRYSLAFVAILVVGAILGYELGSTLSVRTVTTTRTHTETTTSIETITTTETVKSVSPITVTETITEIIPSIIPTTVTVPTTVMTTVTTILTATPTGTATPRETTTTPPTQQERPLLIAWMLSTCSQSDWDIIQKHSKYIDIVSPDWYYLASDLSVGKYTSRCAEDQNFIAFVKGLGIKLMPMLVSANATRVRSLITNTTAIDSLADQLIALAKQYGYYGYNIDFEVSLPDYAAQFAQFIDRLAKRLHQHGLIITVDVPAKRVEWPSSYIRTYDYAALAQTEVDAIIIMAYDFYEWTGKPKPVAPLWWVEDCVKYALQFIPREKLVLGVPNYGKIWYKNGSFITWLLYPDWLNLLQRSGKNYTVDVDIMEKVLDLGDKAAYFVDGEMGYYRALIASKYGLKGVATWRLDLGDPEAWKYYAQALDKLTPDKPSLFKYLESEVMKLAISYPLNLNESCILVTLLDNGAAYLLNPYKPLIPASNMKLLVAVATLKYLGAEYRFRTEFYAAGSIENGTLRGHLVVRGYGDPSLISGDWADAWTRAGYSLYEAEHKLDDIISTLKALGIERIEGDIVVDDYYLDHEWVHPSWEPGDLSYYYAAQIGALSINRNIVLIRVYVSDTGAITISVAPDVGYVNVTFAGRVVNSSSDVAVSPDAVRVLGTNNITITGDFVKGRTYYFRVTVHDPGLYFGAVLRGLLVRNGIQVSGIVRRENTSSWSNLTLIGILESQPLETIIRSMLKYSVNLYADHLFKVLGKVVEGEGSWSAGSRVLYRVAVEDIKAVDFGIVIADGSGLSRQNRLTCSLLAKLLTMYFNNSVIYNSLPIAGVDGTLANRMKGTPAQGNLRAKTGTMTGVSALSGYVNTSDGRIAVFSMIFNGFTVSTSTIKSGVEDYLGALLAKLNTSQYNIP